MQSTIKKEKCIRKVNQIIQTNPKIQFLIEYMNKIGCKIPTGFIRCDDCSTFEKSSILSAYMPPYIDDDGTNVEKRLIVCYDKNATDRDIDEAIIHELIHALDDCRAKIDFTNCLQHACTEIRASTLSGECTFGSEWQRGKIGIFNHFEKCVKRRVTESISTNPNCAENASEIIEQVWSQCYNDIEPFTRKW